jgi:hypothetical protein
MATAAQSQEELSQNSISIAVCFRRFKMKKYEESKLSEIYSVFCALINSHGGLVTFSLQSGEVNDARNLERRIYQKFADIRGYVHMRDAINRLSLSASEMIFKVEGMSQLCTLHYNIYIPTELQILPLQFAEEIKRILQPKRIIELDRLIGANDYHKVLVSGKPLTDDSIRLETKTVQLKLLKSEKGKRTTLGDRMTSKENKFANYVSAFANDRGGHVYYGVDDDGIVWGQYVEDRNDITKKVRKAMNKVIWPSDNGRFTPIQGQHWDIFFEPVKDENGRAINKTFVIVIYISYCSGGVFAMEPESYHIVDGNVVSNIPFQEWKRRVLHSASHVHSIARSNFTTTKSQNTYYTIMEKMMDLRNQGKKKIFKAYISHVKQQFKTVNVQLSTLSQEATYQFRLGNFELAEELIQEYDSLHPQCEENMLVPGSMGLYIKSANKRAQGEYQESYELAKHGLQMAEGLTPGLIQAWFCTHTALLANILANKETDSERRNELVMEGKRLLGIALSHSNHVKAANKFIKAVVDLQQKVYIHLSELYLGLSLSGSLASSTYISVDDVLSANNCLSMVAKLEEEGHKLSPLREVQYLLALSALFYRQYQLGITKSSVQEDNLTLSLEKCDKALELATSNEFKEMIRYSRQLKDLIVDG